MTPNEWAAFLDTWKWLGVLILVVLGGHFRVYVLRWQYDNNDKQWQSRYEEMTKDRDYWRAQAEKKDERLDTAIETLDKAVDIAQAQTQQARPRTGR